MFASVECLVVNLRTVVDVFKPVHEHSLPNKSKHLNEEHTREEDLPLSRYFFQAFIINSLGCNDIRLSRAIAYYKCLNRRSRHPKRRALSMSITFEALEGLAHEDTRGYPEPHSVFMPDYP